MVKGRSEWNHLENIRMSSPSLLAVDHSVLQNHSSKPSVTFTFKRSHPIIKHSCELLLLHYRVYIRWVSLKTFHAFSSSLSLESFRRNSLFLFPAAHLIQFDVRSKFITSHCCYSVVTGLSLSLSITRQIWSPKGNEESSDSSQVMSNCQFLSPQAFHVYFMREKIFLHVS